MVLLGVERAIEWLAHNSTASPHSGSAYDVPETKPSVFSANTKVFLAASA